MDGNGWNYKETCCQLPCITPHAAGSWGVIKSGLAYCVPLIDFLLPGIA